MTTQIVPCPGNNSVGKPVKLATVKNLLNYEALARIEPTNSFFFCADSECEIVYYSAHQAFTTRDLRMKVYPKDLSDEVPLCYCFGWTGAKLNQQIQSGHITAPYEIRDHIKANRCACDLRNPQGSCCLGNVEKYIRSSLGEK